MGVRTKKFGPTAWVVFEGLARCFDEFMSKCTDSKDSKKMLCLFSQALFSIGFILPCVYCRVSFREFSNPVDCDESLSISKMLTLKNGGSQFIYNLHRRVSKKLEDQEMADVKMPDKKKIAKKWKEYNISFQTALKTRFKSIETQTFWSNFTEFIGYCFCDYRSLENFNLYMFMFLESVCGMISMSSQSSERVGKNFQKVLSTFNQYSFENPDQRFDFVWNLQKSIFPILNFKIVDETVYDLQKKCEEAIVVVCKK
jgi:hypothetical protein